jgi:hypothetical protein
MIRAYFTLVLTLFVCESVAQVVPLSSSGTTVHVTTIQWSDDTVPVPLIVRFSGELKSTGSTAGGIAGVTISIYSEEEGGVPLWAETQNVQLDSSGRYSVLLGQIPAVLPLDIFALGAARWIGIVADGYLDTPRTQIVSAPYALSALNAEMLGGHPASDFALVQQLGLPGTIGNDAVPTTATQPRKAWTYESTAPQGPSFISDATSGPPFAIGSQDFVANLNVDLLHGLPAVAFAQLATTNAFLATQVFKGGLTLLPTAEAQIGDSNGKSSSGLDLVGSAFNTGTSKAERERFRWQTEAVNSNSANPSGRLSLLFGSTKNPFAETGFSINADGTVNLVPSQQIPLASIQGALASAGLLDPVTGGSPQTPVVNTAPYQWQQTPTSSNTSQNKGAIQVGINTVTLDPCPKGVNGNDVWHYLYISGTGTPEAVLITGGSCISGATSGTIEFSAANSHSAGYTIGTATAGAQEALISAAIPGSNGATSRNVQLSPGSLVFHARLSIRTSGLTIGGSGSTIVCTMEDTCIMVGDPSNATLVSDIVLQSVTISPNIPLSAWPAVEDNGQGTVISKLRAGGTTKGNTFKSLIQIDNDQAAQINGLDTNSGSWSLCNPTYCSTAVVGAGPAGSGKNAGVIWIQNSNLSSECSANGIDNQDGNTLNVQNTVVQAYPEFGIRSHGTYGANPNVALSDVYMEIGNCVSPLGTGIAGLIVEGGYAQVSATVGPTGELPQYSNSGTSPFGYYIVVHSSQMGVSPVYLAGYALSDGTTGIPVKWDQVGTAGTITYDVLRIAATPLSASTVYPYGTGNYAVATGVTTGNCSNMVCSILDNPSVSPAPYTVVNGLNSLYSPALTLWPASVVLTTTWDTQNMGGIEPTKYFADTITGGSFVNSEGANQPSVFALECNPIGGSPIWTQCQAGTGESNDYPAIVGTLIQMGSYGGNPGGLKGRTIYELPDGSETAATEIITLGDSNEDKTTATTSNRPSWDDNDTYVGLDQSGGAAPLNYQLAFGAPVAISNYIGSAPTNGLWLERLTSKLKTFKVPVSAMSYLTSSNCLSADGVCGSAAAGEIAIAAGTQSVTVLTTSVTALSEIHIDENFSYGPVLGVSCDRTLGRHYAIADQWPGIGFLVITDVPPASGAACLGFSFEN